MQSRNFGYHIIINKLHMYIWKECKAEFFLIISSEILRTFVNLEKNTLISLSIPALYCFENNRIYSELVFFGKFLLGIILKTDNKDMI